LPELNVIAIISTLLVQNATPPAFVLDTTTTVANLKQLLVIAVDMKLRAENIVKKYRKRTVVKGASTLVLTKLL